LNKLVAIDGIVTKVGLVHPKLERLVQYCEATGSMEVRSSCAAAAARCPPPANPCLRPVYAFQKPKNYHDETSLGQNRTSNAIVQKDAQNNQLTVEYGLSRFKNHQKIHLQEMPENAELGTVPRDITVLLDHDLVDCCKPGDRVRITGIFMAISQGQQGQSSGVFPTFIYALNARSIGRTMTKIMPSQEDIKNIKIIAHRPDAFDVLSRSLANSIHGHDNIKKGLLLLLLGGQEKNLASGLHLRGDINILLVGDPSTAKSQLLRFVINTAPLAISTSGRGSSGVGLTAAVTHSDGEPKLEAGAMVLADRGVVCIDEFDKMLPNDRVAIHEIMEQQTVTINKAGIHASLNARCSVFAAANPVYGTYDKSRSATANIGLEDSILSRFDLLFVVLDSQTPERDRRIADHVLRSHRYREDASAGASLTRTDDANDALLAASNVNSEPVTSPVWSNTSGAASVAGVQGEAADSILTTEFMKKFIYYARTRTEPSLTAEARDAIAHAYSDLRANSASYGARMSLPITPRTLESIIRLSTAYARCSLSKFITQVTPLSEMNARMFLVTAPDQSAFVNSFLIQAHVLSALGLLRSALFGDVEQARPPSSSESESEDDDDDSGGGAATRTPTRTPAKGSSQRIFSSMGYVLFCFPRWCEDSK
jgi:DNA replication licensing factor MCM3